MDSETILSRYPATVQIIRDERLEIKHAETCPEDYSVCFMITTSTGNYTLKIRGEFLTIYLVTGNGESTQLTAVRENFKLHELQIVLQSIM